MKKPKKFKRFHFLLIILLIIILLILLAFCAVIVPLTIRYNSFSYEYQPTVERESEYIMPEYPEISIDTDGKWQEGADITEIVTDSIDTDITITESEFVETETEPITLETEAIYDIPAISDQPIRNDEPLTNPNYSDTIISQPSNPNASFSNSPNAVSVYGNVPIYKVQQKDPNVKNILVLGTDSRDITADRGRSDTMIIVSYNEKTGSVKFTSLLRDSLVPIEGYDWNRINTAYFFGGVGLAINTLNQLFDLDIQNFVVIDLNGAANFVDYIGGVDVYLTQAEAELYHLYTGRELSVGINHLDSRLAMTHMRNRSIGSDFERTRRQRDVIVAIINHILKNKSVTEIYDIVNYSFSLIKTNISASDLIDMASSVLKKVSSLKIESQSVPYTDLYKFGWYKNMAIITLDIPETASRVHQFIYE